MIEKVPWASWAALLSWDYGSVYELWSCWHRLNTVTSIQCLWSSIRLLQSLFMVMVIFTPPTVKDRFQKLTFCLSVYPSVIMATLSLEQQWLWRWHFQSPLISVTSSRDEYDDQSNIISLFFLSLLFTLSSGLDDHDYWSPQPWSGSQTLLWTKWVGEPDWGVCPPYDISYNFDIWW